MPQTRTLRQAALTVVDDSDDGIAFEDAVGGPAPATGIDIDEAMGLNIPDGKPTVTLDQINKTVNFDPAQFPDNPDDSFFTHMGKTLYHSLGALRSDPAKTVMGAADATASGLLGMAQAAVGGLEGLATVGGAAMTGRLGLDKTLQLGTDTIEASQERTTKLRDFVGQVTKVNVAPEADQGKQMEKLLMLLPEGITAAGDNVYEKTGNALAGAGTQALLTLLTFKPSLAVKPLETMRMKSQVGRQMKAAIEGLAKTDPEGAEALAKHVEADSPQTADTIRDLLQQVKDIPAESLGEQQVKQQVKKLKVKLKPQGQKPVEVEGITAEDAGVGIAKAADDIQTAAEPKSDTSRPQYTVDEDTGQHTLVNANGAGEFLAQENRQYLQVKRSDVALEARGKGHAVEAMSMLFEEARRRGLTLGSDFSVSPDAQRVYASLKKQGFEVKENPSTINPDTGNKISTDPRVPVFEVTRAPASEAAIDAATQVFISGPTLDSLPGGQFAKGKLKAWYEEAIRTVAPEALGPQAKMSAAVLANRIAESMNKDAANYGRAKERRTFWEKQKPEVIRDFMKRYEGGTPNPDPILNKAAENIRTRNTEIYAQDTKAGIKYDPIDNYLYHVFEDGEKLANHFQAKYGVKWGDPKFTKERSFDLYEEAIKAGFKPRFTNPEEIMLARQHASDTAQMKVEILSDLEGYGLAKKVVKGSKGPPADGRTYNYRRSPSGDGYWVDSTADAVLHNAFDTKSLWTMPGIRGDAFRGAMFLKNTIVPIKLAISLFHPLHVATIDNATGMVRASKSLLSGNSSPVKWLGQMLDSAAYGSKGIPLKGLWDNPSTGNRILRAYQGKLDPAKLTAVDTQSLQYMAEGGMIPEMSVQYKTGAMDSLRKAVRQTIAEQQAGNLTKTAENAVKSVWHLPFAVIQALQKPMFEIWIPSLKIASYLKDVATAIKTDPSLVNDKGRRLLAFRRLAKSVDNRYGEMAYNTLFWNRTVKDLSVANTLSLGWNLGFIREYGGGAMDIGQSVTRSGSLAKKAAEGKLDRPLFVSFYTTQALLYGGLLTWALTGQSPQDLMDYIYPKNGNVGKDGKDERVNTMFYPREFAAIEKHIEHEGVVGGLTHLAANKASGVVGMVSQWASGVNSFDQEIRDPNSQWHQQVRQTLAATLLDLEPISIGASRQSPGTFKDIALNVSGFSPAPKYVTQSPAQAEISTLYKKYYAPKQTPYETALLSADRRKLKELVEAGKVDEYGDLLDKMQQKYDLTSSEQMRLAQGILKKSGTDFNPYLTMFTRLTWQQQVRVLDKMTEDERLEYLPVSNKDHVRYRYEAPEKRD